MKSPQLKKQDDTTLGTYTGNINNTNNIIEVVKTQSNYYIYNSRVDILTPSSISVHKYKLFIDVDYQKRFVCFQLKKTNTIFEEETLHLTLLVHCYSEQYCYHR